MNVIPRNARAEVDAYLANQFDSVVGMSSLFATRICASLSLFQAERGQIGDIAEIGVFKGRFLIPMTLTLAEGEKAIGIDDFHHPDQLQDFTANLKRHGVPHGRVNALIANTKRFDHKTMAKVLQGKRCRFFHVDGRHKVEALANDLAIAATYLDERGIICVDDMQHPCYPLLPQVVHRWIEEHPQFTIFCVIDREDIIGAGKYLICGKQYIAPYVKHLAQKFDAQRFTPAADFGTHRVLMLTPDPKRLAY